MSVLKTEINVRSAEFKANAERMVAQVDDLKEKVALVSLGGDAEARERHLKRGKLLPRERVRSLLDPGSPFLEIGQLAAWGMYDGDVRSAVDDLPASAGSSGRECVIVANDATVKGGTYYPMTVKKHLRAQEIALQNRLPCIYLVDSGGALPAEPGRGVPRPRALRPHLLQPGQHVGARASRRSPCVMGSCTAGGAYVPAMCDEIDHRARTRAPSSSAGRRW